MGLIGYTIPTAGSTSFSVAAPEVSTALQTILTWANGNIDAVNLSALLAQAAGVNQAAQVVKGATNIATSESRTNVAYGTMPTPDQVTGIVLPTNGLIAVWYQATWQESVASAAQAAIFLGSNQLQIAEAGGSPVAQSAQTGGFNGLNLTLATSPVGLLCKGVGTGYTGDVTTGQVMGQYASASSTPKLYGVFGGSFQAALTGPGGLGGPCYIFAAAGTYTVSVQFKASSGSVTALNRKLWVQALSFA